MKPRNLILLIFKIIFLLVIFYYLYQNSYINFKNLSNTVFDNMELIILISLIGIVTIFFANLRWLIILRLFKFDFKFWEIFKITYIGIFFNNILLGAYGGDIARIYYSINLTKDSKKKITFSIILDRIFGFLGLTIICIFFFFKILSKEFYLKLISYILENQEYLFFVTIIFFLLSFLATKAVKKYFKNDIFNFLDYKKVNIFNIFYLLIISVIIFIIINLMIYLITNYAYRFNISLNVIFFTNSIALFVNSLPLTPGGIGLGEIAYTELINLFNEYKKNLINLSNVYLIFRIINLTISLPGIIFFLLYKKSR
jgi:glycosyltransferase 2 family protein